MINVKEQVYAAIKSIAKNVSDSYPADWLNLPAIQYVEEDNKVHEFTDGKEDKSYVRYRVDIWHNRSTSQCALDVDKSLAKLGLRRTFCQDVPDASLLKHKVMRYEAIVDNDTEFTYQP
ncbi:hypothetical protein [Clostridium culturomicium]|uniref:hypothetical protein n=1 Tax=Clostridium culturomicium TaxID=1499683 RepID=UPI003857D7A2